MLENPSLQHPVLAGVLLDARGSRLLSVVLDGPLVRCRAISASFQLTSPCSFNGGGHLMVSDRMSLSNLLFKQTVGARTAIEHCSKEKRRGM